MQPFISICIPAYQRVHYLRRLLNSLTDQLFTDFEVVVSDDSKDDSVLLLVEEYKHKLPIAYYRNNPSLGTPANWNFAISKAKGEWIKLIHDDDWLSNPNSLDQFAHYAKKGGEFIFSAYSNQFEEPGKPSERKFFPRSWRNRITREPMTLLAYNVIGPPSVIMVHRSVTEKYDERLKWRVDMEYYVRLLTRLKRYEYIDEILVNVGVSESQVTQSCIYQPQVELPEGLLLLQKHGAATLSNIWVYDAWWRLLRNMNIVRSEQLSQYAEGLWPPIIPAMVQDLAKLPNRMLKFGPASKAFMLLSYFKNKSLVNRS